MGYRSALSFISHNGLAQYIFCGSGLLDEKEVELSEEEKLKIKNTKDFENSKKTNTTNVSNKPLKTAGSKVATQGVRKTGVA